MKSDAKEYNAELNSEFKQTGNQVKKKKNIKNKDQLQSVLQIVGRSHKNGLPFVKEIGLCHTGNQGNIRKIFLYF